MPVRRVPYRLRARLRAGLVALDDMTSFGMFRVRIVLKMTNVDGAAKKILRESEADRQLRLPLVSIRAQRSSGYCAYNIEWLHGRCA